MKINIKKKLVNFFTVPLNGIVVKEAGSATNFGINPINGAVLINNPIMNQIREYRGPEEITRSRFRQLDEYRAAQNGRQQPQHRFVKMELLNE